MTGIVVRYALALIILAFGLLKFTAQEAEAIRPLVESSPLMGWAARQMEPRLFSATTGVVELAIVTLIALRPVSARLCAAGSALAVGLFLTTLSFLFSTPGIWQRAADGYPFPGPVAAFLLKDVVLIAVALWSLREAVGTTTSAERQGGPACSSA
jgi:uncharacterized membrane protein YkgB